MVKKVLSQRKLTIPEVYDYLVKRMESAEPTYFQRLALDHAELVRRTDKETALKIVNMLVEDFRVSDNGAISIANYLPNTIDELRAILGSEARLGAGTTFTTEILEQILNRISEILSESGTQEAQD